MSGHALTTSLAGALEAAGIPIERVGRSRTARLGGGERAVYRWILRRFADGEQPDLAALEEESARHGLPPDTVIATLTSEDLVHIDESGIVIVAYPFSGRPTPHRVRFNDREVYAMCALDALGIAPMLGEPIEITSRDPLTGEAISVELEPDGQGSWQPQEAVVVSGRTGSAKSYTGCCPVLNFFASTTTAERWLAARPHVHGIVISIDDAIVVGRAVFGDILEDA